MQQYDEGESWTKIMWS